MCVCRLEHPQAHALIAEGAGLTELFEAPPAPGNLAERKVWVLGFRNTWTP